MVNIPDIGEVEILDAKWYNVPNYQKRLGEDADDLIIGIVSIETQFGERKSYIGVVKAASVMQNIIEVIQTGVAYAS